MLATLFEKHFGKNPLERLALSKEFVFFPAWKPIFWGGEGEIIDG